MTVIDVNTGKFVGQGGNLEQTVTRNNLEAAEEIVRQLRLRDIGGIIVIDFIDMVLETQPRPGAAAAHRVPRPGPDQAPGRRGDLARAGADDPQAGRAGAAGGVLRAVPDLRRPRAARAHRAGRRLAQEGVRAGVAAGPARSARCGRRGGSPTPAMIAARGAQATPDEVDVASEDHRAADEAVDTVEAVEPEADVTVRPETEPAAPVAAGIGELPPPSRTRAAAQRAEPVPTPTPRPAADTPAAGGSRRGRRRPRPPPGRRRPPTHRPTPGRPDAPAGRPSRRTGRRRADAPAGPVHDRRLGDERRRGRPPDDPAGVPDGGTAPDGSEPVAGSNGVVAPGTDTAEFPSAPEPVAGSNGAVGRTAAAALRGAAAAPPAARPDPRSRCPGSDRRGRFDPPSGRSVPCPTGPPRRGPDFARSHPEEQSSMYAIVKTGGKQYKVAVGDVVEVEKIVGEPGASVDLPALLLVDGEDVTTDADALAKVAVTGEVVAHTKGPKIKIHHFKNKTGYHRRMGHRQPLTQVKVTGIESGK